MEETRPAPSLMNREENLIQVKKQKLEDLGGDMRGLVDKVVD